MPRLELRPFKSPPLRRARSCSLSARTEPRRSPANLPLLTKEQVCPPGNSTSSFLRLQTSSKMSQASNTDLEKNVTEHYEGRPLTHTVTPGGCVGYNASSSLCQLDFTSLPAIRPTTLSPLCRSIIAR